MSTDYLVASLLPLAFDAPPPYTAEAFAALAGDVPLPPAWLDLEAQIRNTIAEERARLNVARRSGPTDAAAFRHPVHGCALYWQRRVRTAFAERDPQARQTALDRIFWDAAGELTPVASPLSKGAIETYAIRLEIVRRRAAVSRTAGNAVLDQLVTEPASTEEFAS